MLEKVIVALEREPAEEIIKELRENLALYQIKLLVRTGAYGDGKNSGNRQAAVFITDRPDEVRAAEGEDVCILLYLTEENKGKMWGNIPYAAEGLEGLDGDFLEKVYRRHVKEAWEILRTQRLIIREMREEDLDALYHIYDQPGIGEVMDGLSEDREGERAYIKEYIEKAYTFYGFGLWILEEAESGRCVGRAGFFIREGFECPELGFIIAKEEQRKGYCFEACSALLEYGFQELGFEQVQALAAEGNVPSLAICAKLGGRREGSVVWNGKKYVQHIFFSDVDGRCSGTL